MFVVSLRRINNDALEADQAVINIDIDCEDVNVVVGQYATSLSRLLDKLSPLKRESCLISSSVLIIIMFCLQVYPLSEAHW